MQSMFDERLWLAWLVKARIIILTFLLGIEMAIARLTQKVLSSFFWTDTCSASGIRLTGISQSTKAGPTIPRLCGFHDC